MGKMKHFVLVSHLIPSNPIFSFCLRKLMASIVDMTFLWFPSYFFPSYPTFMKDYCPRSCDRCPLVSSTTSSVFPNPIVVASKCEDGDKRCPAWAAYANQCRTNRLFMSKTCKKSCGLCGYAMHDAEDTDSFLKANASESYQFGNVWLIFTAILIKFFQ